MGPVNMMALEEYKETAERHEFLESQRTDLIDSIENTQASIKEIDEVSRVKFDEAFKVINEALHGDVHEAVRRQAGVHAADRSEGGEERPERDRQPSRRRRARSCRTCFCSRVARRR